MIGDSITQGYGSSGGIHPYPEQLQILLDRTTGIKKLSVHPVVLGDEERVERAGHDQAECHRDDECEEDDDA